jgi:hypothetical protein
MSSRVAAQATPTTEPASYTSDRAPWPYSLHSPSKTSVADGVRARPILAQSNDISTHVNYRHGNDYVGLSGSEFGNVTILAPERANRTGEPLPGPSTLQCKLTIGQSSDSLEHEADEVARRVMRVPDAGHSTSAPITITSAHRQLRGKCACEDDVTHGRCAACNAGAPIVPLQRQSAPQLGARGREAPGIVDHVLRSSAQPLDPITRTFFEERFGHDFSQVRVHTDSTAARSATAIGAHAYTVGSDIVFNAGRFDPSSQHGRELIAHELTHVVQQRGQPKVVSRDEAAPAAGTTTKRITSADGVRALANRFDAYAARGEAALPRAPINARDADRIRANLAKLRIAIAGMRTVADNGDEHLNLALLGSFTRSSLKKAAESLQKAGAAPPAVTVSETAPVSVAACNARAVGEDPVEREAREIGRLIRSVEPSSASSPSTLVMRLADPVLAQQIEQNAGEISQIIRITTPAAALAATAEPAAVAGLAAFLASPVGIVAAVVVVALLAAVAIWYFCDESKSEETRKSEDAPIVPGSPAPAAGVTPPSPTPPPVPERRGGAAFAELDQALAVLYIRAAQGQRRVPVMKPGWSRAKKEKWKECHELHESYDVTKDDIGNAAAELKKVRGKLDSLAPDEQLQFCAKIYELLGFIERLLNQRRRYDELECDEIDWFEEGKTAEERRRKHLDEMDHLKEQEKNLREELRRLQNPPPGKKRVC